jgi:putative IMPACT (imprinted ancient) family translation regulator
MLTLERPTSLEQTIKKSRFVAKAGPVASEQGAKDFIAAHSDPGANHNCWAWRVGQSYRSSDDDEPGGTAGKPILQAIDRLSLDNVAVVVSRWFGGVLLGSGGLIRAYGGTAAACLRAGKLAEIVAVKGATIAVSFSDLALAQRFRIRWSGADDVDADARPLQVTDPAPDKIADCRLRRAVDAHRWTRIDRSR